jgi:hypothetical protein
MLRVIHVTYGHDIRTIYSVVKQPHDLYGCYNPDDNDRQSPKHVGEMNFIVFVAFITLVLKLTLYIYIYIYITAVHTLLNKQTDMLDKDLFLLVWNKNGTHSCTLLSRKHDISFFFGGEEGGLNIPLFTNKKIERVQSINNYSN